METDRVVRAWFDHLLPARSRYRRVLAQHHAGRLSGAFTIIPASTPAPLPRRPLSIHFWTPRAWPSTAIHVDRVIAPLRAAVALHGLPWQIGHGPDLPEHPVDWLLCLKTVPPRRDAPQERTVLLLNDDADRVWGDLPRFDDVVVVSSPVLASLVGCVHPRVWFVEETESTAAIAQGDIALTTPPSLRDPVVLWNGTKESLDGLLPLREVLDAFARQTGASLSIVTNRPAGSERWGALPVRFMPWSVEALTEQAARARLGLVPARPTLADSYLKSAGRLRCLFALGCPAVGDKRSPDVVAFSEACGLPAAHSGAEWLEALLRLWQDPAGLDAAARRGHERVRTHFSTDHTARQWLWLFATATTDADVPGSRA